MCIPSQSPMSHTQHFLVSAYGSRWRKVTLIMLTVYVDDSGTSPSDKVPVAAGLIVPAHNLHSLHREWKAFDDGYHFKEDFHTSECVAKNPKSVFANWKDPKIRRALARARRIAKRNSCKAISVTHNKQDVIDALPEEWKQQGGQEPFTWSLRSLLFRIREWNEREGNSQPIEYVIDWLEPNDPKRIEAERLLAQLEYNYPGEYSGHYSFRHRKVVPGLQCADLLAWTCFNRSKLAYRHQNAIHRLAEESFKDFSKPPGWLDAVGHELKHLLHAVGTDTPEIAAERREWTENYNKQKEEERQQKTNESKKKRRPTS